MSLKVWQATGGKLAQVLVGHSHAVTCVAVSVTNKTQVISGSKDTNLIIWDIHTGDEIHTLAGHLAQVTGVKISADGTTAVSGSDDKTLIVWETKRGLALTSLQIHVPFIRFDISLECSRILVQIEESTILPVICLHNTPASYIKLPTYSAPARDAEGNQFCLLCFYFCFIFVQKIITYSVALCIFNELYFTDSSTLFHFYSVFFFHLHKHRFTTSRS